MNRTLTLLAAVAAIIVLLAAFVSVRAQGANGAVVITKYGLTVEEVRVGSSCVVVVTRAGINADNAPIAVVPCR